jgi:hypothetical protein
MPFNVKVGDSIEYKAAKPTNWKDGDYKKIMNNTVEMEPGNNDVLTKENLKKLVFFQFYENIFFRYCQSCFSQSI